MRAVYVMARNASGRPTLQHRLVDGAASITLCGTEMLGWSRWYSNKPIEQLLCRRCGR